jgi:MFS family permease
MEDLGSVKRSVMRDVLSIYIPSFFNMIGMSIVSPILSIYSKSFGVSHAVASLAISMNAFGRFLADVSVGVAADRWDRHPMMLAGTLIITAMALANANAPNFSWFLVFRFLQGAGSGPTGCSGAKGFYCGTVSVILVGEPAGGCRAVGPRKLHPPRRTAAP